MKREIVLDTETTGLDPFSGHRMVEIGCVEVIGAVRTGQFFHTYLNPERDMPAEAERVHGLSSAFLKDKPVFSEKVDDFLAFIGDSPLVIHNAGFDMKFINYELENLGFKAIPMSRTVDTVMLARRKFPGSPASLDALCKRFDIDLTARTKHGALLDAELLAEVYLELLGGKQAALVLEAETVTAQQAAALEAAPKIKREAREFPLTQEEQDAHNAMLERFKATPLWKADA